MSDEQNLVANYGSLTEEESTRFQGLQNRQQQALMEAGQLVFRIIDIHRAAVELKSALREEFFKVKDRLEIPDGVNFQIVDNQVLGVNAPSSPPEGAEEAPPEDTET